MQVVSLTTKAFSGDVLVMNNEQCGKNGKGGVSLWNVSNPLKPYKLSEHWGDRGGLLPGDSNDTHSAFAWDAGDKAYVTQTQLGLVQINLHDMVVKKIDGHWIMLLSYWDGGYVQLNVDNPAAPAFIGDTDFNNPDPELLESAGVAFPPEGNGHQAEFTADNRFFIATDEDFAPYGATHFEIAEGTHAGTYPSVPVPGSTPIVTLDDELLNGPMVYGRLRVPGFGAHPATGVDPRLPGFPRPGRGEDHRAPALGRPATRARLRPPASRATRRTRPSSPAGSRCSSCSGTAARRTRRSAARARSSTR
jgi:hypothetical protein